MAKTCRKFATGSGHIARRPSLPPPADAASPAYRRHRFHDGCRSGPQFRLVEHQVRGVRDFRRRTGPALQGTTRRARGRTAPRGHGPVRKEPVRNAPRRYGFHGLSYEYIASRLAAISPAMAAKRTVVAHLGNGSSLCAMRDGQSIDTTMGLTPLDGLVMGTRCGLIDPGVLLYLQQEQGL